MKLNKTAYFLMSLVLPFFIVSCGAWNVSYPKEKLNEILADMVKKDTGVDAVVEKFGRTLYLDMQLKDLTSNEADKVNEAVRKMQSAVLAITRVVLSSDSEIKYMAVSAFDDDKQVLFRIVQNIDDVKNYMHMRISRGDYETRNLLEIEGPDTAPASIDGKHDISDGEYVARMIISQVNMSARTNPFLGVLISMLNLRYLAIEEDNLVYLSADISDDKVKDFIVNIISRQAREYSEKYSLNFKNVAIQNSKGERILDIKL
ncbi:MAG: hypothetical protein LBO62_05060 [Endomicrobium sp.]|jgi:hypothetical protein|nr:hypothetical protein [Endomicrobium sp.]